MNFEDINPPGQVNRTKSGKKVKAVYPDKKEASVISPPIATKRSKAPTVYEGKESYSKFLRRQRIASSLAHPKTFKDEPSKNFLVMKPLVPNAMDAYQDAKIREREAGQKLFPVPRVGE